MMGMAQKNALQEVFILKLLSIAIPCYNSAAYMDNCIKSLLPGGDEVEILIVHDGSTKANTAEIADRYEKEYPGSCRAIHQENGGHGEAVNAGLRNATGVFFKVVDSDDWVNEEAYMKVLETLRQFVYGKDTLDMLITNFVYEKQGAKHKKVMNYNLALPKNEVFTWSDAKYMNNARYTYTRSIPSVVEDKLFNNPTTCYSKGMREGGTPLSAASLAINYRIKGWFLSLTGNYYDRIYLSFAPNIRVEESVHSVVEDPTTGQQIDVYNVPEQAKGKGGFMLDASIGHQFRFKNSTALSVNLNLCNITNNQHITTGGFEQSRTNTPILSNGVNYGNPRIYDFSKNPRKFYAQGINGMLNINYRF